MPDPLRGDTQPVRRTRPTLAAGAKPSLGGSQPEEPSRAPEGLRGPRRARGFRAAVLGVGLLLGSLLLGLAVHLAVRDLAASWTGTGLTPFQVAAGNTSGQTALPGATPTAEIPPVLPQPWTGTERITILVMGLDYRDWLAGSGPPRTDSMMVFTYDPITRLAGMISVPRDLWVEIPGLSHNRINTAYPSGEARRLPGGGAALAMQAVEDLLGVPIQYYMIIEFSAFERMIDEIGGIDVLVREPIRISPIGRYSLDLEAKPYHFDGPQALAYARVRTGPEGDFGRARRQQQVALAIIDRVVGFDMIPTLVSRAPALYQELAAGIHTNLTLDQMVSLAWLVYQVPKESIRSGVIGPPNMVAFYTVESGANVLRPVPDQIRILRDQIFVDTSALSPSGGSVAPPGGQP